MAHLPTKVSSLGDLLMLDEVVQHEPEAGWCP